MENPTKMDDLEGTTIFGNIHIYWLVDGWTTHLKKYAEVKWDHFPRDRGENIKCLSCHHPALLLSIESWLVNRDPYIGLL